jgi:lysozyme
MSPAAQIAIPYIKEHEGFRSTAYPDGDGWSIGYGRYTGKTKPPATTREAEDAWLVNHVAYLEAEALKMVRVPLNPHQLASLVDFMYTAGVGALKSSTLLKKLNQGDYVGAAEEFRRWVYGRLGDGKGTQYVASLARIRETERAWMLTGTGGGGAGGGSSTGTPAGSTAGKKSAGAATPTPAPSPSTSTTTSFELFQPEAWADVSGWGDALYNDWIAQLKVGGGVAVEEESPVPVLVLGTVALGLVIWAMA